MECVYCAVRSGYLYIIQVNLRFKGLSRLSANTVKLVLSTSLMCIVEAAVSLHVFLAFELNGGGWLTSRAGRFNPRKEPRKPISWRLGGPRSRCGLFQKRKVRPYDLQASTVTTTSLRSPDYTCPVPVSNIFPYTD
jgi:hypothetical protein